MTSTSPPASRQSQHGGSAFSAAVHTRPKSSGGISVSALTRGSDDEPKTAVKVAIRLRPPLEPSDPGFDLIPARFNKSTCHVSNPTTLSIDSPQGKKLFVFDRVFADSETQAGVWDYISSSVDAFVQGYNVSILAYGQSGAGKSYTMGTSGPDEQDDLSSMGIVPRAAAALFDMLSPAAEKQTNGTALRKPTQLSSPTSPTFPKLDDKSWQLKATYVEIYNEQLRDLLVPEGVPAHERPNVTIREDTKGRIIPTGLKQVSIGSIEDLMAALSFGSSIRQTDATAINSKSSRSHAVFSLNLIQKTNRITLSNPAEKRMSTSKDATNGDHWATFDSKLHFVDLAGSERLKNSGLTGDRVKEGISINAGLASLGKVISQLSSRAVGSHVSYRDSRLTRMLQDSLGGNAITYMVACVNPVEFHLSETLNTVQYAQRARAIQSRPQIQQRSDEGDKQLIIDRLRSEIKFLREQIRSSQHSERRSTSSHDRGGRKQERENELQEQLLDIQENYSALSQRHAKLVSELTKGKSEDFEQLPALKSALESTARDRLSRSNNFAEAVENVILEYEKTIQSLETSLSNTRSSLSTSESGLLEREAKIVYMEAVTQQLQSRLQKATDREQHSEFYARELESKLDGLTSGEDKQAVVIQELRKEMTRIRESEASAEDYISTLEERLAEAEQDTEVMQREISRLEHLIERQRSVGKLDNLLSELDDLRHDEITTSNGDSKHLLEDNQTDVFHDRLVATASGHNPNGELHPDAAEEEWKSFGPMDGGEESANENGISLERSAHLSTPQARINGDERVHSPAQARAIQDKLETLTMELFELRGDHESTVAELDDVSRKYQIALSTLAELQDAVDEARQTRPQSFLERPGFHEQKEDGPRSSSRMLSSELSSRGESPTLVEVSDAGTAFSDRGDFRRKEDSLAESVRALKRSNAEKDININELTENYAQLQDQHKDTLNYIEELKEEMQKLQTPMLSTSSHLSKRRSNQVKDREGRVFASLQNFAVEHLQSNVEARKTFENSLGAAMTESQLRNGRIQALEAELTTAKKEINVKNTMISGLTRERTSRSTQHTDMALVATMRDHLVEAHKYLSTLHEANGEHEKDLMSSVESLKATVTRHGLSGSMSGLTAANLEEGSIKEGAVPATSASLDNEKVDEEAELSFGLGSLTSRKRAFSESLPAELATWVTKHKSTFESVHSLEQHLLSTISGLETTLRNAEALSAEAAAAKALRDDIHGDASDGWVADKAKHLEQIANLQAEIEGYRKTTEQHASKLEHLENAYARVIKEADEDAETRRLTESELQSHRELVSNLEDQIDQQKSLTTFHQQGLKSLQESHSKELDELHSTQKKKQAEHDAKVKDQYNEHQAKMTALEGELTKARLEIAEITQSLTIALNEEPDSSNLHARLQELAIDRQSLVKKHNSTAETLQAAREEMQGAKQTSIDLEAKVRELTSLNEETLRQLEKSVEKEQRSSKIVNELEEQLNSHYNLHKDTTKRLSSAQQERAEMEKELEEFRSKVANLESQLHDMKRSTMGSARDSTVEVERSSSNASALRKSTSQVSFASPPPSVPLPPLPLSNVVKSAAGSPPPSRHNSKEITATLAQMQQQQQALEEQSARIKAMEKHLSAEKQLTQTLEEALMDLETQNNKTRSESEAWKKKCREVEEEATGLRRERGTMRNSIQAVEEERDRRIRAEQARRQLEERMEALGKKGKKKGALNCF